MTAPRRLRVAFLTAALDSGGSERQMLYLAERLPRDRFAVDFILITHPGPHYDDGLRVGSRIHLLGLGRRGEVALPVFLFRLVRMALRYVVVVRRGRYDIVDAWLYHAYALAAAVRPIAGPRVLISGRRSLSDFKDGFGRIARWFDALARRRSDAIVANSTLVLDDVVAREHPDPARLRVIRNGVPLAPPLPDDARRGIRAAWGVGDDDVVVGCVANYKRGKGLELLVGIAASLGVALPGLRLVLIGDGSLRPVLETMIREARVGDRVILHGWEPDARRLYGALDILVQASDTEGLPNVVLEAAAAGTAIVATDTGGTAEIVDDGRTGLLVPVGDAAAIEGGIERLALDSALRSRFGEAARAHVTSTFGMDRLIDETAALYDDLAARAGVRR